MRSGRVHEVRKRTLTPPSPLAGHTEIVIFHCLEGGVSKGLYGGSSLPLFRATVCFIRVPNWLVSADITLRRDNMAKNAIRSVKTKLICMLSDPDITMSLVNMVYARGLLTRRLYNNLLYTTGGRSYEDIVVSLLDKIMGDGEARCQIFMCLLEEDFGISLHLEGCNN